MERRELIKLLIPFLGIVLGVFIKLTKNKNYVSAKKYWLFIVIASILLFFFRLFKYLK